MLACGHPKIKLTGRGQLPSAEASAEAKAAPKEEAKHKAKPAKAAKPKKK